MKTTLIGMFCFMTFAFSTVTDSFLYTSSDIENAKKESRKANKPMLLYYTADWCTPCQLMEQGTFTDEYLLQKMNEKYITVEVDRDDTESKEIIEKYNICCLPTFQITDHKGKTMYISEGSLSGGEFYKFLEIEQSAEGTITHKDMTTSGSSVSAVSETSGKQKFVSGKVEVDANTYAEIQAAAVNPANVSSKTIITTSEPTKEVNTIEVNKKIIEASTTDLKADREAINVTSTKNVATSTKSNNVKTGRLDGSGKSDTHSAGEIMKSPEMAYVEKERTEEKVTPEVAKEMINILEEIDTSSDKVKDHTESELAQMSSKSNITSTTTIVTTTQDVAVTKVNASSKDEMRAANSTSSNPSGRRVLSTEELEVIVVKNPKRNSDTNSHLGSNVETNNIKSEIKASESKERHEVAINKARNEKIINVDLAHEVDVEKAIVSKSVGKVEYVQAGAFRNILNADRLRKMLSPEIDNVIVTEDTKDDCSNLKMYRVLLGPIIDNSERVALISKLEQKGIIGFSVLQ